MTSSPYGCHYLFTLQCLITMYKQICFVYFFSTMSNIISVIYFHQENDALRVSNAKSFHISQRCNKEDLQYRKKAVINYSLHNANAEVLFISGFRFEPIFCFINNILVKFSLTMAHAVIISIIIF